MGCGASASLRNVSEPAWQPIPDQFQNYEQVTAALRQAGLESSQLIVGVDFTGSNQVTGKSCFGGRCLHDVGCAEPTPYEQAISVIANVLSDFDDDNMIPAYGFGDARTGATGLFSFQTDDVPCDGLDGVLQRYRQLAPNVELYGPTSFAALIRQAINLVKTTGEYHILLIIADGQMNDYEDGKSMSPTADAIVEASNYPLSIVMVGVGDGPWQQMEEFDDELPTRKFDNFQFVNLNEVWNRYPAHQRESAFAVHALMEVPDQYKEIKRMKLLSPSACSRPTSGLPRLLGPPPLHAKRVSQQR